MAATDSQPGEPDPATPSRRRRIALAWTLVAVWAGVIWSLGGDDWSLQETSRTLSPLLEFFFGELEGPTKWRIYLAVRKSAHFVEYGVLALLTFRAALISAPRNRVATAAWTALFLVALVATADEARQAFSTARTGSPNDILIDVTGGAVAIGALLLISRRLRAPEDSPSVGTRA
ncbi:MAG: VanZ family protein [bacterium]|nr:VanZ family protein [bacterium]